ncbi:MAG: ester cyclase [Xanthobacteraceae bacterium]
MSNANIAQVQDLYAAFGRGDTPTLLAALDPQIDWQAVGRRSDFPTLGPCKGVKQVEEFFQRIAENEDFSEFSPREFYAADDKVFVLGTYTMKIKKTGKSVATEWVHVFTLKGGKVVRFREHTDTAQLAAAFAGADKFAIARRFIDEVCNGRKLALADEIFSGDHAYRDPGSPGVGKGPAGIKELIGTYHRAVNDARWEVRSMIHASDTVVMRWTGSGTHTGELFGIPPTHRKVRVDGIWMLRITDGKIVESWNCWDTLGLLQQLGVVPLLGAKAA